MAHRARADSGTPSITEASVTVWLKALVSSSTWFEKDVESLASRCLISLKRSFWAPSSPTPPIFIPVREFSTARFFCCRRKESSPSFASLSFSSHRFWIDDKAS